MSFCFVVFWGWRARNNFVILSAARETGACETKSDVMFPKKCSSLEARLVSSLLSLPLMNPCTLHCLVFHYIFLLFKSCLQSLVWIPSLLLLLSDHLFSLFLGLISHQIFSPVFVTGTNHLPTCMHCQVVSLLEANTNW